MKYLEETFKETIFTNNKMNFYFGNCRLGVLDIETTGLNPEFNQFVLGGLLDCSTGTIHQFFADNRREEKDVIMKFYHKITEMDAIVTYNGRRFDIPFIRKRLETNSLCAPPVKFPCNLDLYLLLSKHSPIRSILPDLKQKTVEGYMGLWNKRKDLISGADSAILYERYESSKDEHLLKDILLHNRDDVVQLTRLLPIIEKTDFHSGIMDLGFPVGPLIVDKINAHADRFNIIGRQYRSDIDFIAYTFRDQPVDIHFDSQCGTFSVSVPILRRDGFYIVDLDALGIDSAEFEKYHNYGSDFLAIYKNGQPNPMEINSFAAAFLNKVLLLVN